MPDATAFTNAQSLLEYVVSQTPTIAELQSLELTPDFNVLIVLHGEQWSGHIDYRIARFVEKLQQDILLLHNRAFGQNLTLRSKHAYIKELIVKVKVQDGSTELFVELKDVIKSMVQKMNSWQVFTLAVLVVLCVAGAWTQSSHYAHVEALQKISKDGETAKEIAAIADKALDVAMQSKGALHYLLKQMDETDEVSISTVGNKLTKAAALTQVTPPDERTSEQHIHIDGLYHVTQIDLERQTVTLKTAHIKPIAASLKTLHDEGIHRIFQESEAAQLRDSYPLLELQVSAVLRGDALTEAYVTGLGPKRDSAISLQDMKKTEQAHIRQKHLSLLDVAAPPTQEASE